MTTRTASEHKMSDMADARYPADLAHHVRSYLDRKAEKPPSDEVITQLLETLFFASLRHEEAQPTLCRVTFIDRGDPDPKPPERIVADRWKFFKLANDVPFTVSNLVKLSQAVDPWGSTLAVDGDGEGGLKIWGLIDQSVHFSAFLVKEASIGPEMPGMFQAVIEGIGEVSAYKNNVLLGTLKQDVLITHQHRVFDKGPVYSKMLPWVHKYRARVKESVGKVAYGARDHWDESLSDLWFSALCRLLIGIHRYRHGGAVLISDEPADLAVKYSLEYPRLKDALVRVGTQEILKTFYSDEIFERYIDKHHLQMPLELHLDESVAVDEFEDSQNELKGCLRFLTSLSRVDGLLWLDSDLFLRGFGVEITVQDDPLAAFAAQDSDATKRTVLVPNHFGMRHRSMLRYCGVHENAIGFVVSQDGDIRTITKVEDAVLLWDRTRLQSVRTPRTSKSLHHRRVHHRKRKRKH
jgi:hypothetical protein